MTNYNTNQVRIIAGHLRGRKISFPNAAGLRPTSDYIRETLFNWLALDIQNATCLDMFAGSGALGFEALSRGAKHVSFIDANKAICDNLDVQAKNFNINNYQVYYQDALTCLTRFTTPFDIIFLDPPFNSDLLSFCAERLMQLNLISAHTKIYCESDSNEKIATLPWQPYRLKATGKVNYGLFVQKDPMLST